MLSVALTRVMKALTGAAGGETPACDSKTPEGRGPDGSADAANQFLAWLFIYLRGMTSVLQLSPGRWDPLPPQPAATDAQGTECSAQHEVRG